MPFDIKDMPEDGLKVVANIPIAAVGEEWDTSTGTTTITAVDLQDAVDALSDPAIKTPRVKLGHLDPRFTPDGESIFDGTPVLGKFENLQIGDNGMTLYADAIGVPEWFANIMPYAYPNRSMEAWWGVKTKTGKTHNFVISAVSLLGDEYPAIETLDDLQVLFSKEGPDWVSEIESGNRQVAAHKGGNMPRERKVLASTSVEDIRRSFFEDFATAESGRYDWWTRAVYVDPAIVIATDWEDNLFACPFSITGDNGEIEWSDPVEVFTQYVETESGKVAAAKLLAERPAVATFSKSGGSRPEPTQPTSKEESVPKFTGSIDLEKLRTRLGLTQEQLPDDADEDAINEALTGGSPDPKDTTSPDQPSENSPATGAPAPGEPSEGGADRGALGPDLANKGGDGAVIDRATLDQLKADAAEGRAARAEQVKARRGAKVAAAISKGKIPPSRREHFSKLMENDEEGTTTYLESLEEGVIPVGDVETGRGDSGDESVAGSEYPEEWLSVGERARIAAAKEGRPAHGRVVSESMPVPEAVN